MDFLNNVDLLSVGITIAGIGILGFTIFFNNPKSITNKSFLLFSIISALWGTANYLNYKFSSETSVLTVLRILIFLGTWHAFSLFQLIYVFPKDEVKFSKSYRLILLPVVSFVSILTLTPLVFSKITKLATPGMVSTVEKGPGILAFVVLVIFLFSSSFYLLVRKINRSESSEKRQLTTIFFGLLATFFLISIFNFLLPALFDELTFIPFGAIFIFPFMSFTSYAIYKHRLFNIKTSAIAIVSFILSIFSFFNIIYANDSSQRAINVTFFLAILVGSISLIKGVLKEIQQREKIERQKREMEIINTKLGIANEKLKELDKQKTEFIGFASHQLRSPLTAIKGYASLILEGDYGKVSDELKHAAQIIFESANTLVTVVADYLNVSSIELGQMKYDNKVFNLSDLTKSVIEELKQSVEKKGLKLDLEFDETQSYFVQGDREKIKQVFMNIIDNSAKYTPKGGVKVILSKNPSKKILFTVKDTGIGISKEVIPKLFAKFIRAKNANETNIRGTGLGLFIAKEIVTAHKGRIWVESGGEGKGSQFYVEIPEANS